MFFDVDDYLRLRDRVATSRPRAGREADHPGDHADHLAAVGQRMVELSGPAHPAGSLEERLDRAAGDGPEENRAAVREIGIDLATELSERLIAEGAPCLHFITLNFARATSEVLTNLGMTVPV